VDEHITFDKANIGITGQQLYNYYLDWCKTNEIYPETVNKFGLDFTKIYHRNGFIKKRTAVIIYRGVIYK